MLLLNLIIVLILLYLYNYKYINQNILVSIIFIYLCYICNYNINKNKNNEKFHFGFDEQTDSPSSESQNNFNFQYNYAGVAFKHLLKVNSMDNLENVKSDTHPNSLFPSEMKCLNEFMFEPSIKNTLKSRNIKDLQELIITDCNESIEIDLSQDGKDGIKSIDDPEKQLSQTPDDKDLKKTFNLTKYENSSGISSMIVMPGFRVTVKILEETNNVELIKLDDETIDITVPYTIKYDGGAENQYIKVYHLVFDNTKIIQEFRDKSIFDEIGNNSTSVREFYNHAIYLDTNLKELFRKQKDKEESKYDWHKNNNRKPNDNPMTFQEWDELNFAEYDFTIDVDSIDEIKNLNFCLKDRLIKYLHKQHFYTVKDLKQYYKKTAILEGPLFINMTDTHLEYYSTSYDKDTNIKNKPDHPDNIIKPTSNDGHSLNSKRKGSIGLSLKYDNSGDLEINFSKKESSGGQKPSLGFGTTKSRITKYKDSCPRLSAEEYKVPECAGIEKKINLPEYKAFADGTGLPEGSEEYHRCWTTMQRKLIESPWTDTKFNKDKVGGDTNKSKIQYIPVNGGIHNLYTAMAKKMFGHIHDTSDWRIYYRPNILGIPSMVRSIDSSNYFEHGWYQKNYTNGNEEFADMHTNKYESMMRFYFSRGYDGWMKPGATLAGHAPTAYLNYIEKNEDIDTSTTIDDLTKKQLKSFKKLLNSKVNNGLGVGKLYFPNVVRNFNKNINKLKLEYINSEFDINTSNYNYKVRSSASFTTPSTNFPLKFNKIYYNWIYIKEPDNYVNWDEVKITFSKYDGSSIKCGSKDVFSPDGLEPQFKIGYGFINKSDNCKPIIQKESNFDISLNSSNTYVLSIKNDKDIIDSEFIVNKDKLGHPQNSGQFGFNYILIESLTNNSFQIDNIEFVEPELIYTLDYTNNLLTFKYNQSELIECSLINATNSQPVNNQELIRKYNNQIILSQKSTIQLTIPIYVTNNFYITLDIEDIYLNSDNINLISVMYKDSNNNDINTQLLSIRKNPDKHNIYYIYIYNIAIHVLYDKQAINYIKLDKLNIKLSKKDTFYELSYNDNHIKKEINKHFTEIGTMKSVNDVSKLEDINTKSFSITSLLGGTIIINKLEINTTPKDDISWKKVENWALPGFNHGSESGTI